MNQNVMHQVDHHIEYYPSWHIKLKTEKMKEIALLIFHCYKSRSNCDEGI